MHRLRWKEIVEIEAMQIEPATLGLRFIASPDQWNFVTEEMEHWAELLQFLKEAFPDFNWEAIETAKRYIDTRVSCWKANG